MTDMQPWLYDTLQGFNDYIYKDIFTESNLSKQIVFNMKENGSEVGRPFWLITKDKKRYIFNLYKEDKLPIKVLGTKMLFDGNDVVHQISNYQSFRITQERKYSFRQLVDLICPYQHTKPRDFLLYKIICLCGLIHRINVRVCTYPEFGKDSIITTLRYLTNDCVSITPDRMPAIEYRLTNKILALNELNLLSPATLREIQKFLINTGDFKNIYEKGTRGSAKYGTKDTYNISDLSMFVFYNVPEKLGEEQKFFDNVLPKSILSRYLPIMLEGSLDVKQFKKDAKEGNNFKPHQAMYIGILRTIEWYKHNYFTEIKDFNPPSYQLKGRHWQSFNRIIEFISIYSKDEEEFNELCSLLYKRYIDYYTMYSNLKGEMKLEVEEETVI